MKSRIIFRVDVELKDFLQSFAEENYTTVTRILVDYIASLKRKHDKVTKPKP